MGRAPVLVMVALIACGPAPDAPRESVPALTRQLGSWTGKGNATLGFVSESGSFRIAWNARNQDSTRPGAFHLMLRSGISGRPLKVIADHQGAGSGTVEFGDDPRMYEFLVESTAIEWSVTVEETFAPEGPAR